MAASHLPVTGRTHRGEPPGAPVEAADNTAGGLKRPPAEVVGAAVFGGVTGGAMFGPVGALIGMPLGGVVAGIVTHQLSLRRR